MKKLVKTAITAGITGVTILNTMPVEVLADNVNVGIEANQDDTSDSQDKGTQGGTQEGTQKDTQDGQDENTGGNQGETGGESSGGETTPETTKPKITCARPSGDSNGWYKEDVKYTATIESQGVIKKAYIEVNGKIISEVSDVSGPISLECNTDSVDIPEDGYTYKVKVFVEDVSGNTDTWEDVAKIDKVAPVFLEGSTLDTVTNSDSTRVYAKEKLKMQLKAEDKGVGIDKYILKNVDKGTVVESTDGSFELEDGTYNVSVVDKLGNVSKEKGIKNIFNLTSNTVFIDKDAPVVEGVKPEGDSDGWYNKDVIYSFNVSDTTYLKKAELFINGESVDSFTSKDVDTEVHELKADTSKVNNKDYKYAIKVVAEDFAGNVTTVEDTINIDKVAPQFKGSSISSYRKNKNSGVFFNSNPTLTLKSDDDKGIGTAKYYLYDKEGTLVSENETGKFVLNSGEYFVQVEDKLGNKGDKISLKNLLGLKSNVIVVDDSMPVIEASRPVGDEKGWYGYDVLYNINYSDDKGIQTAKVTVNGVVVDEFDAKEDDVYKGNLKADTSKATANSDGSYVVSVEVVDISGNVATWSDTIYIDRTAPKIDKFVITAEGYKEGSNLGGSDKYGFYVVNSSSVEVYVSDGEVSSGVSIVQYTLKSEFGKEEKGTATVENGVARITLPSNFKGFISAYAVDNVGNVGKSDKPDGIITEDGNVHINNSRIDINLPETSYRDNGGLSLYNKDITAEAIIVNNYSGLRKVEWGIDGSVVESVSIDNNGGISGDLKSVNATDKNLILSVNKLLAISGNRNNINIWVRTTDRVGHVSETSRTISIDKVKPVIGVTYDSTNGSGFYSRDRVATISIVEANFNPNNVVIEGAKGTLGSWSNVDGVWMNTMTFNKDGDYTWSINCTDLAGNKADGYYSEKFTIDKTAPVMSVSFDNNNAQNGNFYKNSRTATVKITEHNFDASLVKLTGNGTLSNWSSNGDEHVATITFDKDGEYEFSLVATDKAGNTSNNYSSGKFIIDKTAPTVTVGGVQNGVSYKKDISLSVKVSDEYLDGSISSVTLRGRTVGEFKVSGSFNEKTGEFTFSGIPNEAKYDDLYTLTIKAYDKAGNLTEQTIQFTVNRFGSTFKFNKKDILGTVLGKSEDISIQEVSVDRLDTSKARVVVIRDGVEIPVDSKYITIKESGGVSGPWVYDYIIGKEVFNKDGKYTVQVYSVAEDGTGNSSLTQEYSFILDTTKPEILVSGVEDDAIYNDVSRKVSIDVRDLSGVGSIDVKLNGKSVDLTEENGMYTLTVEESSKVQELKVTVVDKAGNKNSVSVSNFLITSSTVRTLVHKSWIKYVIGGALGIVAILIGILFKRRKDSKEEELRIAEETAKMYRDSSTGGSSSSSANSTDNTTSEE